MMKYLYMFLLCVALSACGGADTQKARASDNDAIISDVAEIPSDILEPKLDTAKAETPSQDELSTGGVMCRVKLPIADDEVGNHIYTGRCKFILLKKGSFILQRLDGEDFNAKFRSVTVLITSEDGQGRAFGTPLGKPNVSFGDVTREADDTACWSGLDFRACARR